VSDAQQDRDVPSPDRRRRGRWLAVAGIVVGAALLVWVLARPTGYAEFGWFAPDPPPQAILTVSTTSPDLVLAALAGGPMLVGLGVGYLVGRRRD